MRTKQRVPGSSRRDVNATRTVAAVLGVLAGVSGLDHGLFETFQGDAPTPGLMVQAIGPAQSIWAYGTEDAFTLVPNFLATGILAIAVGVLISAWSIGFIHRQNGSGVFLVLGTVLFLVGGGVAQVVFIALGWAVSRRINRPWTSGRHFLPVGADRVLAKRWWALLLAGLAFGVVALEIAISGFVPGVTDPDRIQVICWTALGTMLMLLLLAIAAGAAHDAERQVSQPVDADPR